MRILSAKARIRKQSDEPLEIVINRHKEVPEQCIPSHIIFLIFLTILITIDVMASTILMMTKE